MNCAENRIEKDDTQPLVLVVDDETSICKALEGVLQDEGFRTVLCGDGITALEFIDKYSPAAVVLDIWMPGMDGVQTLTQLRARWPNLPVIMISGHATIATALKATKLGAVDFFEKPLDLNGITSAVHRAVTGRNGPQFGATLHGRSDAIGDEDTGDTLAIGSRREGPEILPIVFRSQVGRGNKVPQRTLKSSAILYGQGLHSGTKSGLLLEPLPADSGIHFVGMSEAQVVPAHVDFVDSTGFATTVKLGDTQVGTIEHLMSALHAYGISNLLIKCNGEVPVMDGSSLEFCELIEEIGLREQVGDWYTIKITEEIQYGNEKEFIRLEPGNGFTVDYTLEYPAPVGIQRFVFELSDVNSYKREIAPARTFGFVRDIGWLQKQGLALGGRFDNFVLIGDEGPINDALRFSDEPVRHKILDAIGDLYLLGRRIEGRLIARMTGHSDNISILRLVHERVLGKN